MAVHAISSPQELAAALACRTEAYARHYDEYLEQWGAGPHPADTQDNAHVLIAVDRRSGQCAGTMRLTTNWDGALLTEKFVRLPADLRALRLVEATRLAVVRGAPGRLAKVALWKAHWRFAVRNRAQALILSTGQALERSYRRLGFEDVGESGLFAHIPAVGEQRVLVFRRPRQELAFALRNPRQALFMLAPHPHIEVPHSWPTRAQGCQSAALCRARASS